MSNKYGLVGWDDVSFEKKTKPTASSNKDLFIRLNQGRNDVRLVTDPYQYTFHRFKPEGASGYGEKVMCSAPAHGECPLCDIKTDEGKPKYPAKQRWYAGVIDRSKGAYKVIDMSPLVFKDLQKLNENERIGNPQGYDINIEVDKTAASPVDYYTVQSYPKEPLSEADVELKKSADLEYLKKKCTPPTPEEVQKTVDKKTAILLGKQQQDQGQGQGQAPAQQVQTTVAPPSSSSEDDEFNFTPSEVKL